jgi:hypothetical protein
MRQEAVATAQKVAASLPPAYLFGWLAGIEWGQVAGFLACLWTLGLMWQHWLWKPFIKPWWQKRRGRSE